jgi:hypothetical protein
MSPSKRAAQAATRRPRQPRNRVVHQPNSDNGCRLCRGAYLPLTPHHLPPFAPAIAGNADPTVPWRTFHCRDAVHCRHTRATHHHPVLLGSSADVKPNPLYHRRFASVHGYVIAQPPLVGAAEGAPLLGAKVHDLHFFDGSYAINCYPIVFAWGLRGASFRLPPP